MPYDSRAQQRKFHVLLREGKIDPETVREFDQSSKGMKLPDRLKKQAAEAGAAAAITGLGRMKVPAVAGPEQALSGLTNSMASASMSMPSAPRPMPVMR